MFDRDGNVITANEDSTYLGTVYSNFHQLASGNYTQNSFKPKNE